MHFAGPVGADGRRPLRRRVHTREILLTSAEQLFIERGYAQVSVSDICSAAGFTRGAFYVHCSTNMQVSGWTAFRRCWLTLPPATLTNGRRACSL